jgi:hypothetical protein
VFSGYNAASSVVIRDSIVSQGGIGGRTRSAGVRAEKRSADLQPKQQGSGGGGGSDPNKGGYGSINAGNGGAGTYNKIFGYLGGGGGGLSDYFLSSGSTGTGDMSIGAGRGTAEYHRWGGQRYDNYGGGRRGRRVRRLDGGSGEGSSCSGSHTDRHIHI